MAEIRPLPPLRGTLSRKRAREFLCPLTLVGEGARRAGEGYSWIPAFAGMTAMVYCITSVNYIKFFK
jgi:hypothetical protein